MLKIAALLLSAVLLAGHGEFLAAAAASPGALGLTPCPSPLPPQHLRPLVLWAPWATPSPAGSVS